MLTVAQPSQLLRHFLPSPFTWLVLVVALATSIAWGALFDHKGAESIRTSDTTDVFYAQVINLQALRADSPEGASLATRIWQDQLAVWRDRPLTAWYQAQFDAYLKSVYLVSGDIVNAYKWLVAPLNFIFLVGCYLLLMQATQRQGISLALAVLASFPIFIGNSGENFGMGPFINFSRRHLYTAFVPFGLYLFYRWVDKKWLLLVVFAYLGLISNLHASGVLLLEIAVITLLLVHGISTKSLLFSGSYLGAGAVGAFVAMGGLWSQVGAFFKAAFATLLPAAQAAQTGGGRVIPDELKYLFYPPSAYAKLPLVVVDLLTIAIFAAASLPLLMRRRTSPRLYQDLLFLSSLSIFAFLAFGELKYFLLAAGLVWFFVRRRVLGRVFEMTSHLITAIFFVGFGQMLLSQWAYFNVPDFPLIFNNLRATRFIGLLVFVWLGILLAELDFKALRPSAQRLCILVFSLVLVADLRGVYRNNFRPPQNADVLRSMMDVARWSKENTRRDARFFVASSAFGVIAERQVYMTDKLIRRCPECAALTEVDTPATVMLRAKEKGMQYALLSVANGVGFETVAVFRNDDFLLVPVN